MPLTLQQQQQIRQQTDRLIQQAAGLFEYPLKPIDIYFDLKGRNLGMYVMKNRQRYIRYNPHVFARHFDACLQQTIPHEVAHYVCDCLYGFGNIKPHGAEWKSVMRALGAEPRVRSTLDMTGLPGRHYRQFHYDCGCTSHQLSSIRHNKVRRGQAVYRCRQCGDVLQWRDVAHG